MANKIIKKLVASLHCEVGIRASSDAILNHQGWRQLSFKNIPPQGGLSCQIW